MCIAKPETPKPPKMPKPTQAMKMPDLGAVKSAVARRLSDQVGARTPTILTSGSGVTDFAATEKKTLLGM